MNISLDATLVEPIGHLTSYSSQSELWLFASRIQSGYKMFICIIEYYGKNGNLKTFFDRPNIIILYVT